MAVYKRAYRPYAGSLTPAWSRFTVLPRYAFETLFRSRVLTGYFVLCFLPAIVAGAIIYLWNTPAARLLLGGPAENASLSFQIDGRFFYYLLRVQSGMAFLLAAWVGPTLVAPDLSNNALSLYLCRPFSRTEYVLGKMSVLVGILSALTWIPDLFLYWLQAVLAGGTWFWTHGRIAYAIFTSSILWIGILSLLRTRDVGLGQVADCRLRPDRRHLLCGGRVRGSVQRRAADVLGIPSQSLVSDQHRVARSVRPAGHR